MSKACVSAGKNKCSLELIDSHQIICM